MYRLLIIEDDKGIAEAIKKQAEMWGMQAHMLTNFRDVMAEFAKVDPKALKDLTGVLKDLTGLMRDFYNIPTPAQAEAQRIAAARLELDRKKAEADSTDDGVEVVIKGEAEEWAK